MASEDSRAEPVTLFDIPETDIDEWGQPSLAKVELGTFMASVNSLTTKYRERTNVRQQWGIATHMVKMKQVSGIPRTESNPNGEPRPNMQILCKMDGKRLNIVEVTNVGRRNQDWIIMCEEHVGATS